MRFATAPDRTATTTTRTGRRSKLSSLRAGLGAFALCAQSISASATIDVPHCQEGVTALLIGNEKSSASSSASFRAVEDIKRVDGALQKVGIKTRIVTNGSVNDELEQARIFAESEPRKLHVLYYTGASFECADTAPLLELYRLAMAKASYRIIVFDSCAQWIAPLVERERIVLAGSNAKEDENGGFLTQELVARIAKAGGADRAEAFGRLAREAASAVYRRHDTSQEPVVFDRPSSPDFTIGKSGTEAYCASQVP